MRDRPESGVRGLAGINTHLATNAALRSVSESSADLPEGWERQPGMFAAKICEGRSNIRNRAIPPPPLALAVHAPEVVPLRRRQEAASTRHREAVAAMPWPLTTAR